MKKFLFSIFTTVTLLNSSLWAMDPDEAGSCAAPMPPSKTKPSRRATTPQEAGGSVHFTYNIGDEAEKVIQALRNNPNYKSSRRTQTVPPQDGSALTAKPEGVELPKQDNS